MYPLSNTPLPPSRSSYSAQQLVRCPAPLLRLSMPRPYRPREQQRVTQNIFMCGFYFSTSACYCLSLPLLQSSPSLSALPILMLVPLFLVVLLLFLPLLSLGHFSEKCFQLLRVGSACAHLPLPPSLSLSLSFLSRLSSYKICFSN